MRGNDCLTANSPLCEIAAMESGVTCPTEMDGQIFCKTQSSQDLVIPKPTSSQTHGRHSIESILGIAGMRKRKHSEDGGRDSQDNAGNIMFNVFFSFFQNLLDLVFDQISLI